MSTSGAGQTWRQRMPRMIGAIVLRPADVKEWPAAVASRKPTKPSTPTVRTSSNTPGRLPREPIRQGGAMAWDFSTEPEFEAKLDWMRGFVREEIIPLETLDEVWRTPEGGSGSRGSSPR